ncbi:MAG TPA: amylo-alpha-1,6-glucosidase [Steroidobacteraceae bacterium]|nr:amylo-alpha-1,6-glucosidase [Steroidobacteraceae bacterium]
MRTSRRGGAICRIGLSRLVLTALGLGFAFAAQGQPNLSRENIAAKYFGADAPWYLRNIPFLEIDDPEIQDVYYYRWKVFRSHIREIGPEGTTVLEFLDNVPWARQPFTDLNDSASFHILEGRWLRDPAIIDSLIDHLYTGGANDRHFSEAIAAATESRTWVTGDPSPGLRHLEEMRAIFDEWDDHFDRARGLYWIEPLLDATEYTIASIDASGAGFAREPSLDQNHNGFTGGFAFRPSINSYQYANALAIAHFATLAGNSDLAKEFSRRAANLSTAVVEQLWNPSLEHFVDRYQRSTEHVTAGEFIRGRELVGYVPWTFELPSRDKAQSEKLVNAWKHVLASSELGGAFGLRTAEPSYPRYLTQYRYESASGKPECQWNGPSWPFQTSQVLTGLANLLDDYSQSVITAADYLRLLRQYTSQHLVGGDRPDIQEDYNPDTGRPIVGLKRSHHYEHSTYVDLIITGLIGLRPSSDETLEIAPLIPTALATGGPAIRYFRLQNLAYHGHDVDITYDVDGVRYGAGSGLSVFVDGKRLYGPGPIGRVSIPLPAAAVAPRASRRVDLAANPGLSDGPVPSASSVGPLSVISEAIDGRLWFFPSNPNGWSPDAAEKVSWYEVDFRQNHLIGSVELYFFADGTVYLPPKAFRLQYQTARGWQDIPSQHRKPSRPLANGENEITFSALATPKLRLLFTNPAHANFRLIEVKAFAP